MLVVHGEGPVRQNGMFVVFEKQGTISDTEGCVCVFCQRRIGKIVLQMTAVSCAATPNNILIIDNKRSPFMPPPREPANVPELDGKRSTK